MWCMTIIAGIRFRMTELGSFVPFKSCLVAASANMTLLTLQQPFIIPCMGRVAGNTTILFIANQMIMGGGHFLTDFRMTVEAGVDPHRSIFALVTIIATFCKRIMQNVSYETRPVASMWIVTGAAISEIIREASVFPCQR